MTVKIMVTEPLFETDEQRSEFAKLTSDCFVQNGGDFEPHRPNELDFSFWQIDRGNDYRIKFLSPTVVEFTYRHGHVGRLSYFVETVMDKFGHKYSSDDKFGHEYSMDS